MSTKIVHS
jgi:hypothetical protein